MSGDGWACGDFHLSCRPSALGVKMPLSGVTDHSYVSLSSGVSASWTTAVTISSSSASIRGLLVSERIRGGEFGGGGVGVGVGVGVGIGGWPGEGTLGVP